MKNGIWACELSFPPFLLSIVWRVGGNSVGLFRGEWRCTVIGEKKRQLTIRVEEVAAGILPGDHVLHCELLEHTLDPTGGTEFRIFAIMHD